MVAAGPSGWRSAFASDFYIVSTRNEAKARSTGSTALCGRAVDALILVAVAGVGAGQRAQRHRARHETEIGVRFAGLDQLIHLIEAGEVLWPPLPSFCHGDFHLDRHVAGVGAEVNKSLVALERISLGGRYHKRLETRSKSLADFRTIQYKPVRVLE